IVQAEVDCYLLVAATRDEGRDRVDVGNVALEREARRHPDHVRLGDALHVPALRHLGTHLVEQTRAEIRADEQRTPVTLGELIDHVEAGRAHGLTPRQHKGWRPRRRRSSTCGASWDRARRTECPSPSPYGR